MSAFIMVLLAQGDPIGLIVERTVRSTSIDILGRRHDVQRREVLRVRGADVVIEDLTFGGRLIIRPGLKRVWRADLLGGEYSELSFDEAASHRKRAIDELRAARERLPGTAAGKEIDALLEGLDQYAVEPVVELRTAGPKRELLVNGDRVRISVEVDPAKTAAGYFQALSALGAFPPAVAAKLPELGGLPLKGTVRYLLFLERVIDQFEVTAARSEPVPDSAFEIPKGMKRVPLRGLEPMPERHPAKPAQFSPPFKEDDIDLLNNPLRKQ